MVENLVAWTVQSRGNELSGRTRTGEPILSDRNNMANGGARSPSGRNSLAGMSAGGRNSLSGVSPGGRNRVSPETKEEGVEDVERRYPLPNSHSPSQKTTAAQRWRLAVDQTRGGTGQ